MLKTYLMQPLLSAIGLTDNVVSIQREVHVHELPVRPCMKTNNL